MKVVGIIQQKGGAGKTTIAVNLAHKIKELFPHLEIALLDTDVQQSAIGWLKRGQKNGEKTSIKAVSSILEGDNRSLRRKLQNLTADVAIIDCPPSVDDVALKTALISDIMLVPVCASALDIDATKPAIDVCIEALEMDPKKKFLLVPSKVQKSTGAGKEIREVLKKMGPVSRASIGLRVAMADAVSMGMGINTYAPQSIADEEIQMLAKEVCELINLNSDFRNRN